MPAATPLWEQLQANRAAPEDKLERGAAYDAHLKHLASSLEKLAAQKALTRSGDNTLIDLTTQLDPFLDTLPYLYVLDSQLRDATAKGSSSPDILRPGSAYWNKLVTCLLELDPVEARYAGAVWGSLVSWVGRSQSLPPVEKAEPCMALMAKAMLRLDPSGGTLTTLHVQLLSECLEARTYAQALELLSKPIHSLAAKQRTDQDLPLCADHKISTGYISEDTGLTDGLTLASVQQYYLMAAMAFIGMHRWTDAQHMLEYVIGVPSTGAANALMVEAYKKWILVSILAHGKVQGSPKTAHGNVIRALKSLSKAYEAIAEAFKLSSAAKLNAEAQEAVDQIRSDGNMGLVRRVIEQHQKLAVSSLAKVYAAVPLSLVATTFSMPTQQANEYLQMLIREGVLNAELQEKGSSEGPILRFNAGGSSSRSSQREEEVRRQLQAKGSAIQRLEEHAREVDRRLSLSKEYLEHTRKARRAKDLSGDAPDVTLGGPPSDDDEHLMRD